MMTARSLFSVALSIGLLMSPFPAVGQQTRLRATLQLPITDALLGKSLARFKEDVGKRSNGEISIEIFDKGKLYIDDQTVGAVESGAIEMGVAGLNRFAKRIPAVVRALGITTLKRWPLGAEYVPIADTLPGYEALGFTGLAVRAGTPREICDQIETAAVAITKEPGFRERMAGMLAEVVGVGAAGFNAFLTAERTKWGRLITDLGLRAG
jgi:hypothetical protein